MKIILLQDVARIGHRFEVKDVPSGHALNFLIPRKMVEPATPENLKQLRARVSKMETAEALKSESFRASLEKLSAGSPLIMEVKANRQGNLFEGIKPENIVSFLTEKGFTVSASQIVLDIPIKETGEYDIKLKDGENEGTIKIVVCSALQQSG